MRSAQRTIRQAGFSLIELMVAVAIVGILSALAMPTLIRYIQKAKTTEARELLQKMHAGARTYYMEPMIPPGSISPLPAQFPVSAPATPLLSCCAMGGPICAPEQTQWQTPTWVSLQFSLDEPHYYQYEFRSSGTSLTSTFTALAIGNLDCDANEATFTVYGSVNTAGELTKSATVARTNELE